MSRAFVKEAENETAELPDRPISPHRNFVTEAGLAAIEAALGRFEAAHRAAADKGDREAAAAVSREVRYWRVRRASAEVVEPPPARGQASFGTTVPCAGTTAVSRVSGSWAKTRPIPRAASYVSPLARAVLTRGPGETVEIAGQEAVILDVR
jgi:transcription elongation GreA/GreB family factor